MRAKADLDADVIIVGAGPTGLLLTNLLGKMGVSCLLLERNASTVKEPRAVSLDDESMRALQAADVDGAVSQITAKGYGSLYRAPSGRVFTVVKPSSVEYGFEKRNAFEQPELEKILRQSLDRYPNVRARFDTEVVSIEPDDDQVTVQTSPQTGSTRYRGQYLVGCDGGRSHIRKLLGVELTGSTFREPWLIVDLHSTENRCFHTEVFCNPARSGITLPGPNGIRRYEFKLNDSETVETAETEPFARKLLAAVGPDEKAPIRRQKVYTFHARIAQKWRVGRVFLAGDAAHLTPPFAGQGMNSGLRDAHNLAWKLDEALRAASPEDLLASYEIERKPHAWSMIQLAMRMGQVMMPSSTIQGWLTRTAFRALRLFGPAGDYVTQMRYKPKPRFSAGLVEAGRRPSKRDLVGGMFPQPMVETVQRERVLLDTILPDQPVVLVFDERPDQALDEQSQIALRDAGAAIVGLTPEWNKPVEHMFPIVRDQGRLMSAPTVIQHLGQALLLRRDRYVMAARPVRDAAELSSFVRQLSPSDQHRPSTLVAAQ